MKIFFFSVSLISSHCLVSLWGSYIDICGQKIVKGYLNQYIAVFAGTVKTELNKILVWLTSARHLSLHYTTLHYPGPNQSSPCFHRRLGRPSGLSPECLSKNLFTPFSMHGKCLAFLILLHLDTRIIFCEQYDCHSKYSSCYRNYFHSPQHS